MYLSERQIKILNYLKDRNDFVTGHEIANEFNISDRTVRNEIQTIKKACGEDIILAARTKGYKYNTSIQSSDLCSMEIITPQDRVIYIIKQLLFLPNQIDIYDIADELYVSERTVETDIVHIKSILSDLGLSHLGLSRSGSILYLRGLYSKNNNLLYDVAKYQTPNLTHYDFQKFFPDINIEYLRFLVTDVLNTHNFSTRYLPTSKFVIDIALLIESIHMHGYNIGKLYSSLYNNQLSAISSYYKAIADALALTISSMLSISLSTDDIKYMAYILYIHHQMQDIELDFKANFSNNDPFNKFCLEIFKSLEAENGIIFIENSHIIDSFILHLKIAVKRSELGIELYNPLLDNFTTNYMHLIDIATMIAEKIEKKYNTTFSFNEVLYIGVYLAITLVDNSSKIEANTKLNILLFIPDGAAILNLIQLQIEQAIDTRKINIKGVTDIASITEIKSALSQYDLIITTSQRLNINSPNVLVIKKSFDISKANRIFDTIADRLAILESRKIENCIQLMTDDSLFIHGLKAKKKEDIIHHLSTLLVHSNYVDAEFENFVLKREEVWGTDLDSGIAFPHSFKNVARKTACAIAILDKPILWKTKRIKIVFLYARGVENTDYSDLFINSFMNVVSDNSFAEDMFKCITYSECCTVLSHYFRKYDA